MILVILGTQKFQFNRLLKYIDQLIEEEVIKDDVYAQVGYSDFIPQNFKFVDFLDRKEYIELIKKADLIITHGGTGAILSSLKNEKRVIAVPRRSSLNEHVDNHQFEIVSVFSEQNYLIMVNNKSELTNAIINCKNKNCRKFVSNEENFLRNFETLILENQP